MSKVGVGVLKESSLRTEEHPYLASVPSLISLASDVTQHYPKPRLSVFYTETSVFYSTQYSKGLSLMELLVEGSLVRR